MTVRKLIDLMELLPPNRRLLGLDIGEKTVGLGLSDISRTVATPMETLILKKFSKTAVQLLDICVEHEVAALIIGLPVNMDGTEGPRCQSVRQFARNLEAHFDMEMGFWDERLSTVAVTKTMIEADMSRAKRAENVDKMAAAYILQGALDFMANHTANNEEPPSDSWG
ncbi:MAG: Holliday junction resolvase RuvX [Alphaproteobacteria bacterium]|nr:Holliday junction resolvase RuvX [Alphaproteobacteria bacterium]